jgi:hypothetical protein
MRFMRGEKTERCGIVWAMMVKPLDNPSGSAIYCWQVLLPEGIP